MNLQRTLGLTLIAFALAGTYGCGKKEEPKKEEPKKAEAPAAAPETVVKIGHVGPLTGSIAHLGKDNENGVRLALDEANAKGVSIDGKKVKFELVAEDDQADPKVGTTVAQKLVDAKVSGIVGHLNSGVTIPASAIYNQAGIPFISGSATNPKVTEQGFKVAFRTVGRDDQQGPAIASYLASEAKIKTVAIVDDATAYGKGLAEEVEKTLKAAGVKVVANEHGTD
jgi:branched-chain amino acid transport system substrate-binding protein